MPVSFLPTLTEIVIANGKERNAAALRMRSAVKRIRDRRIANGLRLAGGPDREHAASSSTR